MADKNFERQRCGMETKEDTGSTEDERLKETISLTHEELLKVTKSTLNELLKNDSILSDLPPDVTLEEVEAQMAVLHGQSITIIVKRGDNDDIPVIVKQKNSTVSDLKRAFQRALTLKLRREGEQRQVGWKYMWRVYNLTCDGSILDSDNGILKNYGVVNKSEVNFVRKEKKKVRLYRRY